MSNFRIVKNAGVWWPVTVAVAIDGGKTEEQQFEMKFRRILLSEYEALTAKKDKDFITAVATDWRGVADGDGEPLPFTPKNIALVVDMPNVAAAIGMAWGRFVTAQPETRLGNSDGSPAGGPAAAAGTADQMATPTP